MSMDYLRSLQQGFEGVEGSADEAELKCLAGLAARPEIKTIGQIGFNVGYSAHNFLEANPDAVLYSFDIGVHHWVRPAAEHIAETFPDRSVMVYGNSLDTVPEFHLQHPELKFDLIFIDGGHEYAVARQDLLNMREFAHPDTVVVIDDLVPWVSYGIGPALAWADLLDEGVVTCDQLWQEGRRVDAPAPPGRRAWAVGRYLLADDAGNDTDNADQQKARRARDLLLAEAIRNPNDAQSALLLARTYFDRGDYLKAHTWYARRAALGGSDEEIYHAMYYMAESMAKLGSAWADVQTAFLKAWEFRPVRAEPLYLIARHYRIAGRYPLGYLFAKSATEIPLPENDTLMVWRDVYAWLATDEQAICASWLGKHTEAFSLCRSMVARPDIPGDARQRIASNRDFSVPAMLEAASSYPQQLVADLTAEPRDGDVTVSLIAGPDRSAAEQSLNTFLNCCTDITQAGRFLVFDAGLSSEDRALLGERYGFIEFTTANPTGTADQLEQIRSQINTPYWLHLGQGWRFFAPDAYLTRLRAVLESEPQVVQVGVNYTDAAKLTGTCAAEEAVRRSPAAGRYVLTDTFATGPAMFAARRPAQGDSGSRSASLDEVLCIAEG